MVTSLLDLEKAAGMRGKTVKHMGRGLTHLHDIADNHRRGISCLQRFPGRGRQLVMIADDMVDLGHRVPQFRGDLRRTSGHDNARLGVLPAGAADRLARLALGLGGHRTGIENDGVIQASPARLVLHHFRFPDIEAAAEGFDPWGVTLCHRAPPAGMSSPPTAPRVRHAPQARSSPHGGWSRPSRSAPRHHP